MNLLLHIHLHINGALHRLHSCFTFIPHFSFIETSPNTPRRRKNKKKWQWIEIYVVHTYTHFFLQMNPSALLRLSCRTWNSQCRHQMSCMECIYSLQTHKSISLLFYTTFIFFIFETGNLFRFMCVYIKFILIHILN